MCYLSCSKILGRRQANIVTSLPEPIVSSPLKSEKLRREDTRLTFARLRYGDGLCSTTAAGRFSAMCIWSQPPSSKFPKSEFSVVFHEQWHVIFNAACKECYAADDQQGRSLSRYVIIAIVNGMKRGTVPRCCISGSCISCAGDILL